MPGIEPLVLWSDTIERQAYMVAASADGSTLVAGGLDNCIYAYDRQGSRLWKHETGNYVYGVAASANGALIAAGSLDNHIYLIERDGRLRWRFPTGKNINSLAISADGGMVVAASGDRNLYAIDPTGKLLWKHPVERSIYGVYLTPDGSTVLSGHDIKFVSCLDRDGKVLWKFATNDCVYGLSATGDGSIMLAGSYDFHVYALNRQGNLLWRRPTGDHVRTVAAAANGSLFVAGSDDRHVYGFDRLGKELWKFPAEGKITSVVVSADGSIVIAGSEDRRVYCLDRTGKLLWRHTAGGPVASVASSSYGSVVFAASEDRKVWCFENIGQEWVNELEAGIRELSGMGIDSSKAADLVGLVKAAFEKGRFDKAMEYAREAKRTIQWIKDRQKEAQELLSAVERKTEELRSFGDVGETEKLYQQAQDAFMKGNYERTIELSRKSQEKLDRMREENEPIIDIDIPLYGEFHVGVWTRIDIGMSNIGSAHAKDVRIEFSGPVDVRGVREIPRLDIGEKGGVTIGITPREVGKVPTDVKVTFKDTSEREYTYEDTVWINVSEELPAAVAPAVASKAPSAHPPHAQAPPEAPSADRAFRKCPYCGERLMLQKTPRYCPYCEEKLLP